MGHIVIRRKCAEEDRESILHTVSEYLFVLFDANCMDEYHTLDRFESQHNIAALAGGTNRGRRKIFVPSSGVVCHHLLLYGARAACLGQNSKQQPQPGPAAGRMAPRRRLTARIA